MSQLLVHNIEYIEFFSFEVNQLGVKNTNFHDKGMLDYITLCKSRDRCIFIVKYSFFTIANLLILRKVMSVSSFARNDCQKAVKKYTQRNHWSDCKDPYDDVSTKIFMAQGREI